MVDVAYWLPTSGLVAQVYWLGPKVSDHWRCFCSQERLSLSTDGDKCAMVNFGGMNKKLLKHVFALYSLPIIFSKNFLARYAR